MVNYMTNSTLSLKLRDRNVEPKQVYEMEKITTRNSFIICFPGMLRHHAGRSDKGKVTEIHHRGTVHNLSDRVP